MFFQNTQTPAKLAKVRIFDGTLTVMNRVQVAKVGLIASLVVVPFLVFGNTGPSLQDNFAIFEKQYQIPTGILNKFMMVESKGNKYAKAPTSTASGLFQWLEGSWTAWSAKCYGGRALDKSERFDEIKSARVTACSIKDSQNKLGGLINSAKVDMTVGLYLGHFLGEGGAAKFLNGYIQKPGGIAACSVAADQVAANSSVFGSCSSGKTYAQVINYYANKLNSAGVGNVPGNFGDANGTPYAKSAADIQNTQYAPAGTVIPQTDPETGQQIILNSPATVTSPTPTNTAATTTKNSTTTGTTTTVSGQPTLSVKGTSAGLIFVQPKIVPVGQNVIVSIATVNMSTSSPCAVVINSKSHQVAYSQTATYQTLSSDLGGLTFTLNCTDSAGAAFTTSDFATVI